jgi:hypothetical protein
MDGIDAYLLQAQPGRRLQHIHITNPDTGRIQFVWESDVDSQHMVGLSAEEFRAVLNGRREADRARAD